MIVVIFVVIQVLSNSPHFFSQGFFDLRGFALASSDAANVRGVNRETLGDAVVNAPKKRDGRDSRYSAIHFVTIHGGLSQRKVKGAVQDYHER